MVHEGQDEWLRPHLNGPCRAFVVPHSENRVRALAKRVARHSMLLDRGIRRAGLAWDRATSDPTHIEHSDGVFEGTGADLVHFTHQSAVRTSLPFIYHPHDLQHLHLPEYFTQEQITRREIVYRHFCQDASLVAVASKWVRDDLVASYGIDPAKIAVVPLAPPVDAYPTPTPQDLAETRQRLNLPHEFLLYPAVTWAHKNHLNLVRAIAELDDRGTHVDLVCSGTTTEHHHVIKAEITRLGLSARVHFVGFVSPLDLGAMYAVARAVVVPTKFEAASFPIWEAFRSGTAVACSTVTSLPEQVGDAALLFDPDDVGQMANAIEQLWTDAALRDKLVARGRTQVGRLDWLTTATIFRAHYRRLAGQRLSAADLDLLDGTV